MRASNKGNVRGKFHQEKDTFEESFDEDILASDSEIKGSADSADMNAAKTFKHLRKDNETEF